MPATASDPVSRVFQALADPTRRRILLSLGDGPKAVGDVAEPFDISLPAVSRHLRILEEAGLISRGREARTRPSALRPEGLRPVEGWIERYRARWEGRLERIEELLDELDEGGDGACP